jgi:hypothetical protein
VFGDGAVKINLGTDGALELISAEGMTRGDIRKAMRIVAGERDRLLQCWRDIHD